MGTNQIWSIIGKVNFNRRFNENGTQIEFDLYPKLQKVYAYVNIGFANTFLFLIYVMARNYTNLCRIA
jgi:YaiO family outer membrane protein